MPSKAILKRLVRITILCYYSVIMSVITIPKELTRGEELVVTKISPLEKRLQQALREVQSGKIIGPFSTLADGLRVLKRHA